MSSDDIDISCSDCKLELIQRQWTTILLKWINSCASSETMHYLDVFSLAEAANRYKDDFCLDSFDYALLADDNVEQFIKYKYPILRLRHLSDDKDETKKMYILTSMLLYHCCTTSQTGAVDRDICSKMRKSEQELIIRFCENLSEMERTINNVDCAIKGAYEHYFKENCYKSLRNKEAEAKGEDDLEILSSYNVEETFTDDEKLDHKFKSSVTVMPTVLTETSSYDKSNSSTYPVKFRLDDDIADLKIEDDVEDPITDCSSNNKEFVTELLPEKSEMSSLNDFYE